MKATIRFAAAAEMPDKGMCQLSWCFVAFPLRDVRRSVSTIIERGAA